jgi:hypothetical protein
MALPLTRPKAQKIQTHYEAGSGGGRSLQPHIQMGRPVPLVLDPDFLLTQFFLLLPIYVVRGTTGTVAVDCRPTTLSLGL